MKVGDFDLLSYAINGQDLSLVLEGASLSDGLALSGKDVDITAGDELYQKLVGYEVDSVNYINGKGAVEVHMSKRNVPESSVSADIAAMNENINAFRKDLTKQAVSVGRVDDRVTEVDSAAKSYTDKAVEKADSTAKSYTDSAISEVQGKVDDVQSQVDLNFGAIVDQALTVDETKEQAELNEGAIIEQALTLEETKEQTDVNADAITDIALTVFENHPPVLDGDEAV